MLTPMPICPKCSSYNAELIGGMNRIFRFRCRECNKYFYVNVREGNYE